MALYISDRLKFLNKKQAKKTLKQFYDYAYQDGYTSSNSLGTWGMIIKQGIKFKKALDVGCGVGAGVKMCREKDLNVYGCDLANAVEQWNKREIESYCTVADAKKMPYDNEEFDLVLCTDVLEHIPEWDIPNTLKELHRVCGDKLFVSVGMHQERSPFKGYIYTHITLKPKDWWLEKIQDAGFNINYAKEHSFHLHIKANKEK